MKAWHRQRKSAQACAISDGYMVFPLDVLHSDSVALGSIQSMLGQRRNILGSLTSVLYQAYSVSTFYEGLLNGNYKYFIQP